jgi:hypothetical protein
MKLVSLAKKLSVLVLATSSAASMAQPKPSVVMGQAIYEQKGANSCMFCHGIDGKGGSVAVAKKLYQPRTWKSYAALGGDAEFNKNKAQFLQRLQQSVVNLIEKGAIVHNASFKQPWFDFKKGGGTFNAQMLGMGGAPSAAWLTKQASKGVTKKIAAEAVYLYLQKFDSQNVFPKK